MRAFILLTAFWAFSALAVDLPQIQKPQELESGEFAEGTMTSLSSEQIKELLPWANNAKKQLSDALAESKRFGLRDRLNRLQETVKTVVNESAPKKYQMLMRYALNRGLLLVDLLDKEADSKQIGVIQNQLDILTKSIQVSFEFYESDLDFQKRSSVGNNVIEIDYVKLGVMLGAQLLKSTQDILDASAQLYVMAKAFELMNWDLYQSGNSKEYAEEISDIYYALKRVPKKISSDEEAIKHIRDLSYLKNKIIARLLAKKGVVVQEEIKNKVPASVYLDSTSGLFWTRESLGEMNHADAVNACKNLRLEGKSWRLPTKEEYERAEKNKIRESLDFKNSFWWSSSVHADISDIAWDFYGGNGYVYYGSRDYVVSVRCVAR